MILAPEQAAELRLPIEIYGSTVPMVTPAREIDGHITVDTDSIGMLVQHLISGGSHGIFVLGTTGEFPLLSLNQKLSVIAATTQAVDHRVPVLVGVSARTSDERCALAQYAQHYGADAIVLAPMYGDGDPLSQIAELKEITARPILLYNNPPIHGGRYLPLNVIDKVRADPQVWGIKDSSKDADYLNALAPRLHQGFRLFQGSTTFALFSLRNHASGIMLAMANVHPQAVARVYSERSEMSYQTMLKLKEGIESVADIKQSLVGMGILTSPVLFPKG